MAKRKPRQAALSSPAEQQPLQQSRQLGPPQPGTIIANYGASLIVEDQQAKQVRCVARQTLESLVCGDRVLWQAESEKSGVIVELQERHSLLARPDMRGQRKIIASNIDQIMIVAAPRPALNEGLLDRYLVAAEISNIKPVLLLNKSDLLDTTQQQEYAQRLAVYTAIGYEVIYTSAKAAHGLDALIAHLQDKTSIFVGQSGVGKSSLINRLLPEANARVANVSDASNKGQHTTTTAWLYHLQNDQGVIIDSPGVREFGLWQIGVEQLSNGFREFHDYAEQCRFRNCLHRSEPKCAVRKAVEEDAIKPQRYESYLRILASLEEENG